MIKRNVWEATYRELIAEGRKRLGEPPSTEALLAYARGELDPKESARLRELLVHYPEVARDLVAPFPSPQELQPGDPGWLSDDVLASDWHVLQARLARRPVAVAPAKRFRFDLRASFWTSLFGLRLAAAGGFALAAALGWLAWRSELQVRQLGRELAAPQFNLEQRLLVPDGERDAAGEETPILLRSTTDHYLLTPTLVQLPPYPDYRLEIVEAVGAQEHRIWSAGGLRPVGNSFAIWMPRAFLQSGDRHRLEIYGVRGGKRTLLATYTIELQD